MDKDKLTRLKKLYKKTGGGHIILSEDEFIEYAALRKQEYQERKAELIEKGATDIKAVKDDSDDIVGFVWQEIPDPQIN